MSGRRYDRDRNDNYRSSRGRHRSRSRSRSPSRRSGGGGRYGNNGRYHNGSSGSGRSYDNHGNSRSMPVPPPGVTPIVMPSGGSGGSVPPISNEVPPLGVNTMVAGMPNLLVQAQASQMEKINRELFVGNIPPGIPDMVLREFFAGAMKRTGLCSPNETPVLGVRISPKFAFMECATIDLANKALNLNGIPFMNIALRVSRPSKYTGPYVPSKTWQQLTGQPLPPGCQPVPENCPPGEDKIDRELFVGNTTPEMTEESLREFLGKAIEQVGLSNSPGNPILSCRMSGKYAFVELRTVDEAKKAMNLNNIPFMGSQLKIGRPSKWTGEHTPHGNWEDILAKFMSGELQIPGAPGVAQSNPSESEAEDPTKIVALTNMLTKEDLESDQDYEEILEDTREECTSFGTLLNVVIPRSGAGEGKIFLEYSSSVDAGKAIDALRGRTFDKKKVSAVYFSEEKFAKKDYSD